MTSDKLTDKQKRFVQELAYGGTQKDAALRAGYSESHASSAASDLMRRPYIREAVQESREALGKRMGITPERILQELALIGFANPEDYITEGEDGKHEVDLKKVKGLGGRAFSLEVETAKSGRETIKRTKFKMLDKADALMKMGKQIGMFTDKVDHNVTLSLEELVQQSYGSPRVPTPKEPESPSVTLSAPLEEDLNDSQSPEG